MKNLSKYDRRKRIVRFESTESFQKLESRINFVIEELTKLRPYLGLSKLSGFFLIFMPET